MLVFLTSSPSGALDEPNYDKVLDHRNGFVDLLKQVWKEDMKGLIIAANPSAFDSNDEQVDFFYQAFCNSGLPLNDLDILDERNTISKEEIESYDMIMLSGGHVPTQNAYFQSIDLKNKIKDFEGIVIGVSAGTMNSAKNVYAQPEEAGESREDFIRFLPGLNLCDINVLPHYQMVKDYTLDGRKLYEDITFKDSYGQNFYVLVDGSYIVIDKEETLLFGEAYLLKDGKMKQISSYGECIKLK